MAVLIDMKAALVKQRKSTSHGTRHTKKVAGTTARRHVGTMAPRHHDGTTARLAAQTECVKIGVERKHHRATTKFYDKKVKLEQEDRYARPQIHCTALPISVPDRAWIISTPSICNYSPLDEE